MGSVRSDRLLCDALLALGAPGPGFPVHGRQIAVRCSLVMRKRGSAWALARPLRLLFYFDRCLAVVLSGGCFSTQG